MAYLQEIIKTHIKSYPSCFHTYPRNGKTTVVTIKASYQPNLASNSSLAQCEPPPHPFLKSPTTPVDLIIKGGGIALCIYFFFISSTHQDKYQTVNTHKHICITCFMCQVRWPTAWTYRPFHLTIRTILPFSSFYAQWKYKIKNHLAMALLDITIESWAIMNWILEKMWPSMGAFWRWAEEYTDQKHNGRQIFQWLISQLVVDQLSWNFEFGWFRPKYWHLVLSF